MTNNLESFLHHVPFGQKVIEFSLQYSNRKTLAISVNPDMSVTVVAPKGKDVSLIKEKVRSRAGWILKQQATFESFLPVSPPKKYVSGESHYYLGRQYRIKIILGDKEEVKLKSGYINIFVKQNKNQEKIEALLNSWLLSHAEIQFNIKLKSCWEKFKSLELEFPELQIRKMSKRWGSCTPEGKIYLNTELIKAPSHCIEYVITHELCHLKHKNHSKDFYALLNRIMPDWESRKLRLEKMYSAL